MKLLEVTVNKFRSIIDSSPVKIEEDITCLVGKNESGKTSFLHALYRLNPARPNVSFKVEDQYPAWLEKKDRMKGEDLGKVKVVSAKFEIPKDLIKDINNSFGENVMKSNIFTLSKSYDNKLEYSFSLNHDIAIKTLMKGLSFSKEIKEELAEPEYVQDLRKKAEGLSISDENTKDSKNIKELLERIKNTYQENSLTHSVSLKIKDRVPKFIYFDKYSSLPYTVKIKELLQADKSSLKDDQLTALALLNMAGADDDYLLNPDYERRKRELENVSNVLTQDVLKYWSQNRELRVSPDITQKTEHRSNGTVSVVDELKIRIWDNKHSLSLPFDEHSTGFQWFFSFLAAFSEYEYTDNPIIILLDEPGLGLHGRAQADFLLFIEERLAPSRQVIYTTHSPFLVQPNKLERTRIVEEKDRNIGTKITQDVFTSDTDTLFPLQGALGYDLVQNLFVSKNNLILEGTSDFVYLTIISDFLKENNRTFLNEKWSLIPVGGADLIPTFVALLGNHLDVTVVIDARKEGNQKLSNLAAKGYLQGRKIIALSEITGSTLVDIEDLFSADDYLNIYNKTFKSSIVETDLKGSDQIVSKIARFLGVDRFDHGRPADYFLRNKLTILPNLSQKTLENFEKLIERINSTFGT